MAPDDVGNDMSIMQWYRSLRLTVLAAWDATVGRMTWMLLCLKNDILFALEKDGLRIPSCSICRSWVFIASCSCSSIAGSTARLAEEVVTFEVGPLRSECNN
jgi:hypothetical protein